MSVAARVCVFCRRQPAQPPWQPFCSERCKLQDLAKWIDGGYRVPAEPLARRRRDDETRRRHRRDQSERAPTRAMADTLTITDNRTGKQYDVPIKDGAIRATDLRQIKAGADDTGLMTYDPAFLNTAACRSAITYIDGDKGILRYRGYPIEQLAEHCNYLEVAYLILFGELPTETQLHDWTDAITQHTLLHENVKKLMEGFQYDAHPMGIFISTVGALSTLYRDAKLVFDQECAQPAVRAAGRQGGQHRRLRVPPQHRPQLRLPGQRPELHRQLPEHAVQDDRAEVPAEPGARARARRAVHPARRPRAELQHHGDAQHRQLARRSVFRHRRRGGGAVGPAARRRERSGAAHARGNRHDQERAGVHHAREGAATAG